MSFAGRLMIQNCESAEMWLNWDQVRNGTESEPKKCSIGRGLVVFVCFKEAATIDIVKKMAKAAVNTKIVNQNDAKPGSQVFPKLAIFGT